MADITIINSELIELHTGQRGYRELRGIGNFNSTDATGTLAVPGMNTIFTVQCFPLGLTNAIIQPVNYSLGSIAATTNFSIIVPKAGTLVSAYFAAKDGATADNTNNWAWGLINKGQAGAGTTVMIDNTANANITNVTGGALTAYIPRSLVLSANSQAVAANDLLSFTMTKASAATTQTESTLMLNFNVGGTDEVIYCAETVSTGGTIAPTSGKITISRTGNLKTSALKFAYRVVGR